MKKRLILLFVVTCMVISACTIRDSVTGPIAPTDTKQPEFTATVPTSEYLGFPMSPAGKTLTQIIEYVPEFKSIEVVPCKNFSDEFEELTSLPPVIYQGESWAESYCLDSLVIDREPGQKYTIFAVVVEMWDSATYPRLPGTENGFYVIFAKTAYPRSDLEGIKGIDLLNLLGIRNEFRLKIGRITDPYIMFGIDEEDYKQLVNQLP